MDEETVQKLQGGGLYAKGSVNSSNGYSGSVTTTLKLSCGDGEAQSTRTGTRVATSYCSGSSAIISLCRSAIEEGRPCESADWFDTPGIGSGSSYSDADFTIEIGDCSGTPAGGTCTAKITEQETKTTNPNDLTALGNSRASSSASNSLYARNVALANGTQTVTTPTQTFSYRSKTESGSQWVNQNEKISQKYAATSHIVSDPSACFNGVCGQDHGPFNTSLYLGNCTTQCNGTTTTTTTSVRQCTVPTDTFSRFCTQPTANQTCTIRRQYTESTCSTTSSDGFETPDPSSCPQSVSGMCWRYKRTRSTTPAGCYMAREGAPTFALNRTGRLQKVAYRAGGIELAAVPCQFVDTSYYRCDTGAEPVISCTDGTTGAGCITDCP